MVAKEIAPPAGVSALEWRLLSNRSEVSFEAVLELIDWYRARWEIELFFHILKNACRIEAMQLSTMERLERAIALYAVVAWRIGRLMRLGRTCPIYRASCSSSPTSGKGLTHSRRLVQSFPWGCPPASLQSAFDRSYFALTVH